MPLGKACRDLRTSVRQAQRREGKPRPTITLRYDEEIRLRYWTMTSCDASAENGANVPLLPNRSVPVTV